MHGPRTARSFLQVTAIGPTGNVPIHKKTIKKIDCRFAFAVWAGVFMDSRQASSWCAAVGSYQSYGRYLRSP